jgi:hypothetical protein
LSATLAGLEVGSLFTGGYGIVKGVSTLVKAPIQIGKALKLGRQITWPSPAKGSSVVNGIEYTRHALERMAPRGLVQSGKDVISRGVPSSVVEHAIQVGSKTLGKTSQEIVYTFENVRVVTNLDSTKVITVITIGK